MGSSRVTEADWGSPPLKHRRPSREFFVLLVSQLLVALGATVFAVFSAVSTVPEERGILAFAISASYISSIVSLLGIEKPLLAHRHHDADLVQQLARQVVRSIVRFVVFALAVFVIFIFILGTNTPRMLELSISWFLSVGIYIIASAIIPFLKKVSLARRDFGFMLFSAFSTTAVVLLSAIFWALGIDSAFGWFTILPISSSLGFIVFAGLLLGGNSGRRIVDPSIAGTVSQIFLEGRHLVPGQILYFLLLRMERFLIPLFFGFEILGIYAVAVLALDMVLVPVVSFVESALSRWRGEKNIRSERFGLRYWLILIGWLSLAIGLSYLLTRLLVTILLPEAYQPAVGLLLVAAVTALPMGLQLVTSGAMVALGYSHKAILVDGLMVGVVSSFFVFGMVFLEFETALWLRAAAYFVGWLVTVSFFRFLRSQDSTRAV